MTSVAQALQVTCSKCGAGVGAGCTYIMPKTRPEFSNSQQFLDQVARAGALTKVPHNERRSAAFQREVDAMHTARRIARDKAMVHNEISKKVRALRDFDAGETMALREWLRLHAGILWGVRTNSIRRPYSRY